LLPRGETGRESLERVSRSRDGIVFTIQQIDVELERLEQQVSEANVLQKLGLIRDLMTLGGRREKLNVLLQDLRNKHSLGSNENC